MGAGVKRYLFDTNILIYYFADAILAHELKKIEEILKNSFQVSIITKIEFFGFGKFSEDASHGRKNSSDMRRVSP